MTGAEIARKLLTYSLVAVMIALAFIFILDAYTDWKFGQ